MRRSIGWSMVVVALASVMALAMMSCSSTEETPEEGVPEAPAGQTVTGSVDASTCTSAWEMGKGFFDLTCDVVLEDPPETLSAQPIPEELGAIDSGTGDLTVTTSSGTFRVEVSRPSEADPWEVTAVLDG